MSTLQIQKTPFDYRRVVNENQNFLELRAKLEQGYYNAGKIYQTTGQIANPTPPDNRSQSDIFSDVEKSRIMFKGYLIQLTDGVVADQIVNAIDPKYFSVIIQAWPRISEYIKKNYQFGVPAIAFVQYIKKEFIPALNLSSMPKIGNGLLISTFQDIIATIPTTQDILNLKTAIQNSLIPSNVKETEIKNSDVILEKLNEFNFWIRQIANQPGYVQGAMLEKINKYVLEYLPARNGVLDAIKGINEDTAMKVQRANIGKYHIATMASNLEKAMLRTSWDSWVESSTMTAAVLVTTLRPATSGSSFTMNASAAAPAAPALKEKSQRVMKEIHISGLDEFIAADKKNQNAFLEAFGIGTDSNPVFTKKQKKEVSLSTLLANSREKRASDTNLLSVVNEWFLNNNDSGYDPDFDSSSKVLSAASSLNPTPIQSQRTSPITVLPFATQPPIATQAPAAFGMTPEQLGLPTGPTINTGMPAFNIPSFLPSSAATITSSVSNQVGPVLFAGVAPSLQKTPLDQQTQQRFGSPTLSGFAPPKQAGGAQEGRMSLPISTSSRSSSTGRQSLPANSKIDTMLLFEIQNAAGPGQSPLKKSVQIVYPPTNYDEFGRLTSTQRIEFAKLVGINQVTIVEGLDKGKIIPIEDVSYSARYKATMSSQAKIVDNKIYVSYTDFTPKIRDYFKSKLVSGKGLKNRIVKKSIR